MTAVVVEGQPVAGVAARYGVHRRAPPRPDHRSPHDYQPTGRPPGPTHKWQTDLQIAGPSVADVL